jgi:hypothetical protein
MRPHTRHRRASKGRSRGVPNAYNRNADQDVKDDQGARCARCAIVPTCSRSIGGKTGVNPEPTGAEFDQRKGGLFV